ncbi:MAG: hypothetical protein JXC85_02070 [Candidatus Aenigmarchaeota archaeon]|nr:hypothetical protein [Candidatus Aenigmarchaeota archaeon]
MTSQFLAAFMVLAALAVSSVAGCVSVLDPCNEVECRDWCSADTRMHGGACYGGECSYFGELCEYGCSDGVCNQQPPHLIVSEDYLEKGGFRLSVPNAEVKTGESDEYVLDILAENVGDDGGIFSIRGASVVAETGIMHDSVGFSWSDFIGRGESRVTQLRIPDVPQSLRAQNTTLVIRTNEGHFYFRARFAN